MHVLTRNTDESIVIGDDIEITVLDINGKTVNLGVSAPRTSNLPTEQFLTKTSRCISATKLKPKVLSINGKQVQLGIKAPRDISVHRSELYLQIELPAAQPQAFGEVV